MKETNTIAKADPKDLHLKNLKSQEQKALAKLERIKTWPQEHQQAALDRTQSKLNQIRESMKQLESTPKPT
jgi:hypothetical protein